jgi:hypothetical protein
MSANHAAGRGSTTGSSGHWSAPPATIPKPVLKALESVPPVPGARYRCAKPVSLRPWSALTSAQRAAGSGLKPANSERSRPCANTWPSRRTHLAKPNRRRPQESRGPSSALSTQPSKPFADNPASPNQPSGSRFLPHQIPEFPRDTPQNSSQCPFYPFCICPAKRTSVRVRSATNVYCFALWTVPRSAPETLTITSIPAFMAAGSSGQDRINSRSS